MNRKILSPRNLARTVRRLKKQKKKIVFTNGTFDLLHLGHVSYLQKAKAQGDILIVGVNTDRSVRQYKGPSRPINPQRDRLEVLVAMACVDYAILFDQPTPIELIKKIKPKVLVKGADWKKSEIVGGAEVESWGGKVRRISFVKGRSSTRLIKLLKL